MTPRRILAALALATAALLAATGCGNDNFRDVKNVPGGEPDYLHVWWNVDKNPNIVQVCVDGVGFATTTRDYTALMRVPEWDAFCATKRQARSN